MRNINKIRSLIKEECAGHKISGNLCWYKDGMCIYYRNLEDEELPRCKYFENGVLPIEVDLEIDYREERELGIGKGKPKKICADCGERIETESNRQKYCDKCKKIKVREQSKERMKKKRD